jgi:hypothetical protein
MGVASCAWRPHLLPLLSQRRQVPRVAGAVAQGLPEVQRADVAVEPVVVVPEAQAALQPLPNWRGRT